MAHVYVVCTAEGSYEVFESNVELAPSALWNLFSTDLNLPVRALLGGVLISLLAHADALLLVSKTPWGLQAMLNAVLQYRSIHQLVSHPGKTVFGEFPSVCT